ncbi:MAG: DUF362 domain-containing protein [Patescibacteria group bacterium]
MKKKTKVFKTKAKKNFQKKINKLISQFELNPGSVLIKPNFNTADKFPASTDKEFLFSVVNALEERDLDKIYIGDSSTFYKSSEKVIRRKQLADLNSKDNVEVVNFDQLERVTKQIPGGKYLKKASIPKLVDEVDNLIYLPCMKTHFHAEYTGAIKLSVGFMPSFEKARFHIRNLQKKIVEMNQLLSPDLIIMDGRKCFIKGGPVHGTIEVPNILLASTDRIAIDLEAVKTIKSYKNNDLESRDPKEIPQIKFGSEKELGSLEYELINL